MIVSLVKGGLGNMMFQIAAGASLAKFNKTEFRYSYLNWHCCTNYTIDYYPSTVFNKIEKVDKIDIISLYREAGMLYQKLPANKDLILDGYFQTEKYFDIDLVRSLFEVPINDRYEDYTFLHIRRGDYVKYSNVHPLMSEDYYREGIEILKPKKVVVLTDDKEWSRNHELFGKFEIPESGLDIDDLSIMKSCKSGVIANSTFSWWGAWLSESNDIVAPKKWFANGTPIEIIPDRWISI